MGKEKFVREMFSSIAPRYDLANSILTLGLDSLWRKKLVRLSGASGSAQVLDCATGTGRLAFEFAKVLDSAGRVVGVDFCQKMLDQIKAENSKAHFQKADIISLPFSENTFDVVSIAYGLRNLSDMEKGLREMARVIKKGGVVMALETGSSLNWGCSFFLKFYFKRMVPLLGGWITGNKEAYQYLYESSKEFPSGEAMADLFKKTGCFGDVSCIPLLGGASFIYKAQAL